MGKSINEKTPHTHYGYTKSPSHVKVTPLIVTCKVPLGFACTRSFTGGGSCATVAVSVAATDSASDVASDSASYSDSEE